MKVFQVTWALGAVFLIGGCSVDKNYDITSQHNYRLTIPISRTVDPLKNYWGDLPGFHNRQAQAGLDLVNEILVKYPPQIPEPLERRLALLMIDGIMHEENAAQHPSVQEFYHNCMSKALTEMENTRVTEGALIWKLYDHGFVVRTATVTLGFDLIRGNSARADGFAVNDDLMKHIVDQCDIMFISHRHGDHADQWVAQAFLDQTKPVVAPDDVWANSDIHANITHLKREAHTIQTLSVREHQRELKVVIYPGHQGDMNNNVSLIFTPEGMSFCHTGDQSNSSDFSWIDQVAQHHQVDVLMPNCWTTDISRMVRGFDPKLIITGHENEMGHTIDHREPYWLTYDRTQNVNCPLVLMTWGESFHYLSLKK
ncbi:MAG: MBL fold metallo-hydrolase [Planctomycetes bacterium]|nr:MBL fold metallo-hydrolase [Planctomycetota bacterium]